MSRLSNRLGLTFLVLVFAVPSRAWAAVPAAENLLPNTTKGFLAVPVLAQLEESWNKTQLGQLTQDPMLKPFMDDLKRQMQEKWLRTHQKLGLKWEDLEGVPTGEVSLSIILRSPTEASMAVTADVTGNLAKANGLLEKIKENLTAQKAVPSHRTLYDASVSVFDIAKHDDVPARQVAYVIKGDLLAVADSVSVIEGILSRQAELKSDSLAHVVAFEGITKRCLAAAGDLAPHARWFIEPFGYIDAARIMNPPRERHKGTDMVKIFRNQGFTAIQGVGGFVNFSVNQYEMFHRTFIYAPGASEGSKRFTLAARMLELPNGGTFGPPDWVPREVATFASLNLNTHNAFESSKTLVDEIVGDEVFEEVLEQVRDDPNGPKTDVRKDLIAHLSNRIVILSDLQLPITPKSERMLIGVETADPAKLAVTIQKWMETDPDAKRREINGHVVWEIVDEEAELPMVTIEGSPNLGAEGAAEEEEEEEKPMLPNSAVTVAYGHLLVATHIDILSKVLADEKERGKLADSADYQKVVADLAKIAQAEQCAQTFTRTDEAYRGVYELLRTGKMPESESMVGRLLNALLGDGKQGSIRPQKLDGSKMPEFDVVRRYLGPAGMTVTTEGDGWLLTGFTLNKQDQ